MDQLVPRKWSRDALISHHRYALILVAGADCIDRLLERIILSGKDVLHLRLFGKKHNRIRHTSC